MLQNNSTHNEFEKSFWKTSIGVILKFAGLIAALVTIYGAFTKVTDYVSSYNKRVAETNITKIIKEYYRLDSVQDCNKLAQLFTPIVNDYFDQSDLTHEQIIDACVSYRRRWAYYENDVDYGTLTFRERDDKSYLASYALIYRTKKKAKDEWKNFYLTLNVTLTTDYKISSIYEKKN